MATRDTLPHLPAPRAGRNDAVPQHKSAAEGFPTERSPQHVFLKGQPRQKTGVVKIPGQTNGSRRVK